MQEGPACIHSHLKAQVLYPNIWISPPFFSPLPKELNHPGLFHDPRLNNTSNTDWQNNTSPSGFGHPSCKGGTQSGMILSNLSKDFPTGLKRDRFFDAWASDASLSFSRSRKMIQLEYFFDARFNVSLAAAASSWPSKETSTLRTL